MTYITTASLSYSLLVSLPQADIFIDLLPTDTITEQWQADGQKLDASASGWYTIRLNSVDRRVALW